MVKATKRSRKFNAKTAGGRGDVSTKKKGKVKQRGGKPPSVSSPKQQKQHDNDNDGGKKKARQQEQLEKLKSERDAKDFTNLGTLDIESFFEKAVDGLEEEEITHDNNNKNDDIDEESDDDDDEGSIDSYASILGSSSDENDEDIEASEKQLRDQLAKLGEDDPGFHKYLKEVRVYALYDERLSVLMKA